MIREMILEIVYIFTNYLVCNIPCWPLRKILYRLLGMKIGRGSRILMKTIVVSPWKISIGDHTYINENCFLDGRGGIHIGSNVTVAVYSKLLTGYHDIDDDLFSYETKSISLEDNSVLFAGCTCLPGVTVEKGAVFAAGSVIVKGKYDSRQVYGGNPAKYIRARKSNATYTQNAWKPFLR